MATTMIQNRVLALCLLLASLPVADAHAQHKQFKDWLAACDNLRNCHAYGFGAGAWAGAYLHLERGGAAGTLPRVTVVVEAAQGVKGSSLITTSRQLGCPPMQPRRRRVTTSCASRSRSRLPSPRWSQCCTRPKR